MCGRSFTTGEQYAAAPRNWRIGYEIGTREGYWNAYRGQKSRKPFVDRVLRVFRTMLHSRLSITFRAGCACGHNDAIRFGHADLQEGAWGKRVDFNAVMQFRRAWSGKV